MDQHNVIAIDLGASSGRLMHIQQLHDRLEMNEIYRFSNEGIRVGKRIYTDIFHIYHEIIHGLKLAVQKIDIIDGIGIDTWGLDFVILDQAGEIIRNPYQYRDPQSHGMIEEANRIFGKKKLFELTGLKDFWCNTIYQILGIEKRNGSIFNEGTDVLLIPDFLAYLLTGTKTGEYTSASLTQIYDVSEKKWSKEILNKIPISKDMLPEILPHGAIKGYLSEEVLTAIGAPTTQKIPLINIAEHDTAAAAYAAPTDSDQYIFISSGTWSIIGTVLSEPVINDEVYESGFSNEGAAYGKTKLVQTIMGMWFVQELRKIWERKGMESDYSYLIKTAQNSTAFARFINVEDELFNAPADMEAAINLYLEKTEQPPATSQGEFYRTVIESLAYTYRLVIDRLTELTGFNPETIYFLGGAARDTMFCQFIADATNRVVCAGPVEATALGNALMQLNAFEGIQEKEILALRKSMDVKYYLPQNPKLWSENYDRFCSIIRS